MTVKSLCLAAGLAMTAAAAHAQQATPRDPANTGAPVPDAFYRPLDRPLDRHDKQCFNGKFLSGANRIGDRVVLLQSARSDVFRLEMRQPCAAIDAARKLRVRSEGSYRICDGGRAEIVALTPAGSRRCPVGDVRALTDREVAALSAAKRR